MINKTTLLALSLLILFQLYTFALLETVAIQITFCGSIWQILIKLCLYFIYLFYIAVQVRPQQRFSGVLV